MSCHDTCSFVTGAFSRARSSRIERGGAGWSVNVE
jgi:hypothetical protein